MSSPWLRILVCALPLAFSAGCGESSAPTPPPKAGADAPGAPALLRDSKREGEIVVKGEASPATHGPFSFNGRYRVRFAQYAPEDPRLDFASQTAFVADLGPARPGPNARSTRLFREAGRSGQRTVEVHGRHTVDVTFGDFPYVIRFTPIGG